MCHFIGLKIKILEHMTTLRQKMPPLSFKSRKPNCHDLIRPLCMVWKPLFTLFSHDILDYILRLWGIDTQSLHPYLGCFLFNISEWNCCYGRFMWESMECIGTSFLHYQPWLFWQIWFKFHLIFVGCLEHSYCLV